jgi:hypothetical protein
VRLAKINLEKGDYLEAKKYADLGIQTRKDHELDDFDYEEEESKWNQHLLKLKEDVEDQNEEWSEITKTLESLLGDIDHVNFHKEEVVGFV